MDRSDPPPLRLHRRRVELDGRPVTVVSPRPTSAERFATNHFHGTWHLLSDLDGARLLGRLCWWLAHSRRPGTVLVIDHPLLVANPFDADPSNPIVIVNADLTPLNRTMCRDLRRWLRRPGPSLGTLRIATPELGSVLADQRDRLRTDQQLDGAWWNPHQRRSWTDRVHGVVVCAAPPPVLRWWAVSLSAMGTNWYRGTDDIELNHPLRRRGQGEVQIFEDFTERVAAARHARHSLFPGRDHAELLALEREQVWCEVDRRRTAGAPPGVS